MCLVHPCCISPVCMTLQTPSHHCSTMVRPVMCSTASLHCQRAEGLFTPLLRSSDRAIFAHGNRWDRPLVPRHFVVLLSIYQPHPCMQSCPCIPDAHTS